MLLVSFFLTGTQISAAEHRDAHPVNVRVEVERTCMVCADDKSMVCRLYTKRQEEILDKIALIDVKTFGQQ